MRTAAIHVHPGEPVAYAEQQQPARREREAPRSVVHRACVCLPYGGVLDGIFSRASCVIGSEAVARQLPLMQSADTKQSPPIGGISVLIMK